MMWFLVGFYWVAAGHATYMSLAPGCMQAHWADKCGAYVLALILGGLFVPAKLIQKAIE